MLKNLIDLDRLSYFWDLSKDYIDNKDDIESATGNPITLTDAANANAEELSMTIEPIQDLHGYAKPWPAGGGKNLFNVNIAPVEASSVSLETNTSLGQIKVIATSTSGWQQVRIPLTLNNGTYTLSITGETTSSPFSGSQRVILYNATKQVGLNLDSENKITFTVDNNSWEIILRLNQTTNASVGEYAVWSGIQLEEGSSASTFEPWENICPINGISEAAVTRTGKNLFGNFELNKSISSETGENIDDNGGFRTAGKIRTAGYNAISLTFLDSTYKGSFIVLQYSDSAYIGVVAEIQCSQIQYPYNRTLTLNPETTYIRIRGWHGANVSSINTAQFQVTLGPTATAYEPYTATNATITFGQTVYGGTVNFKTGQVTVTHGMVDLGTLDWFKQDISSRWRFYAVFDLFKKVDVSELCGFICSIYIERTASQTYLGSTGISGNGLTSNSICVCDMSYADAATFKTAMSGVQLCYELATPTTLTLTPAELELLKGNNTITANGAEISLSYYSDNAIGILAGRVDDVQEQVTTKANTADVNTALATKADITTVTIPAFTPSQAGWRRICKIEPVSGNTIEGMIYIGDNWSNGQPPSASVAVNTMSTAASLTLLSSVIRDYDFVRMTAVRLVRVGGSAYWLDAYFPAYSGDTGPFKLTFTGDIAVSDIQNPISITTDATAATAEISLNQGVSGTVLTDKSGATKAYVDDLIKTEYVSSVISSMTGNSNTTVSIPLTIPNGYVAIGCLQMLTSTRSAAITGAFINATDSTLKMNCVNLYSNALSDVTVGATVAYIRS